MKRFLQCRHRFQMTEPLPNPSKAHSFREKSERIAQFMSKMKAPLRMSERTEDLDLIRYSFLPASALMDSQRLIR